MYDSVGWNTMLVPKMPLLEIFIRGTMIYLSIFVILRVLLKRQSGSVSVTDLLVVVLIADAAQNGMAGDCKSVPEGIFLVMTIVFWSFALDWLGYHIPAIGRVIHPPPLPFIVDGKLNRKNLQAELVTHDELMSQLREQGVKEIGDVKLAQMEGDGRISIVKKDGVE